MATIDRRAQGQARQDPGGRLPAVAPYVSLTAWNGIRRQAPATGGEEVNLMDPMETIDSGASGEAGVEPPARRIWIAPRIETFDVAEETMNGIGFTATDGAGGGCIS